MRLILCTLLNLRFQYFFIQYIVYIMGEAVELNDRYYSVKCGIASFIAKYIVAIFHPLEVLKTRIQSHDGKTEKNQVPKYNSIIHGIKTIYEAEGITGLYRGVHLSTFLSAFSSACFFFLYEKQKLKYESQNMSTMMATSIAGVEAGLITVIVTQPAWVIKTRVLLNTKKKIGQFQNIKQRTLQIWKQQKFKGFLKGLSLNIFLSVGGALRVFTYEGSKLLFQKFISESQDLKGVKHFVSGGTSKLITTLLSYPFTTVRTRIQQNQYFEELTEAKYKNINDVVSKIIKNEGVLGFYKGLVANLIRVVPMRSVYFYSYELLKSMFIDKNFLQQNKNKQKKQLSMD